MSTQATLELMGMTCLLYMIMSYPVAALSRRLEKRLGVGVDYDVARGGEPERRHAVLDGVARPRG